MNPDLVEILCCPICRGAIALSGSGQPGRPVVQGQLRCEQDHVFRIADGVPRLLPHLMDLDGGRSAPTKAIQDTYDALWGWFRPGDREWARELEDRVDQFLPETRTTAGELIGMRILDAGCGTGTLTQAITRFGCESVGLDVSESVVTAHQRMPADQALKTSYIQGDLVHHPFDRHSFDLVYIGGVLHLNPDPEAAFRSICEALKPEGTMFIWVYRTQASRRHKVQLSFRAVLSRLPHRVRVLLVLAWAPVVIVRQDLPRLLGRNRGQPRLRWRERVVHLLDHYTPQYRWELEIEDVRRWFEDVGFRDIEVTPDGLGFGAVATKT